MRMCACRGTSGVAHVSCLAEQAKILFAEAEENHLDNEAKIERSRRWYSMSGATAAMFGCWAVLLDRRDVGSCGSRPLDGGVAPAGEGVLQCRRMPVDDAAVRAALGILPISRGAVCADVRFDLQRRRRRRF